MACLIEQVLGDFQLTGKATTQLIALRKRMFRLLLNDAHLGYKVSLLKTECHLAWSSHCRCHEQGAI